MNDISAILSFRTAMIWLRRRVAPRPKSSAVTICSILGDYSPIMLRFFACRRFCLCYIWRVAETTRSAPKWYRHPGAKDPIKHKNLNSMDLFLAC